MSLRIQGDFDLPSGNGPKPLAATFTQSKPDIVGAMKELSAAASTDKTDKTKKEKSKVPGSGTSHGDFAHVENGTALMRKYGISRSPNYKHEQKKNEFGGTVHTIRHKNGKFVFSYEKLQRGEGSVTHYYDEKGKRVFTEEESKENGAHVSKHTNAEGGTYKMYWGNPPECYDPKGNRITFDEFMKHAKNPVKETSEYKEYKKDVKYQETQITEEEESGSYDDMMKFMEQCVTL